LAQRVAERIAFEKKVRLTLNQELESAITDKFKELKRVMKRLELDQNLEKAALFINEYANISFYTTLASLG
jgi:hypothetical protein